MDSNSQPDERPTPDPEHSGYPAPENAVRSPGEIGGKKFRVGLDDAYIPFRNRSRRRRKTMAVALGGLAVLGVGAYGLVNLVTAPAQNAAAAACKAGSTRALGADAPIAEAGAVGAAQAAAPNAGAPKFTLNVYNSTQRQGLAAHAAAELKQRGFVIGQVTNDPLKANLAISAQVRGAKSQAAELHQVAAEVPGAQIQTDGRTDPSIDLVLGSAFNTLASTQQVTAQLQAAQASAKAAAPDVAAACPH
jgi:hypothetical protein